MKRTLTLFTLLSFAILSFAQILRPIKWNLSVNNISETEKELVFKASIDKGWHLYSMDIPEGGPVATNFTFSQVEGAKLVGKVKAVETPISKEDPQFEMVLSWFERNATFIQKIDRTSVV